MARVQAARGDAAGAYRLGEPGGWLGVDDYPAAATQTAGAAGVRLYRLPVQWTTPEYDAVQGGGVNAAGRETKLL